MGESGRSCKPKGRRTHEAEPFEIKPVPDGLEIELRGRLVKKLVGRHAEEVLRAVERGDADEIQRIVARKVRS